jgi:hypothetical protein
VSYTVIASNSDTTGTVINAQATVVFYTQPPIKTSQIFNTIDSGAGLASTVAPLPAQQSTTQFSVAWSGSDANAGSAISGFTIYVSDNGNLFTPWLQNTTLTSTTYTGRAGHTYGFYSIATDNAGNQELKSGIAEATITVTLGPTVTGISPTTGQTIGGTLVTIIGTNLGSMGPATVYFGTIRGTIVSDTGTQILATRPVGAVGTVDVAVTTGGGTSSTSAADQFSYLVSSVVGMAPDGSWWVALSNGTGFVNQYWGAWNGTLTWKNVQVADFNGDAKSDIVGMAPGGSWWVALSNGTGFVNQSWGAWNGTLIWKNVATGAFSSSVATSSAVPQATTAAVNLPVVVAQTQTGNYVAQSTTLPLAQRGVVSLLLSSAANGQLSTVKDRQRRDRAVDIALLAMT